MRKDTVIFILCIAIAVLLCVIAYQHYQYRSGLRKKLREMTEKLKSILDNGTQERLMVFTSNSSLTQLSAQINRLLDARSKARAEFLRSERSSKRMLSNVSHDIKTPMTVILGYLEIMRINGGGDLKMLEKVEQRAERVMELVNQFFSLAKLEAGDVDIPLSRIDICEACRENVVDFYELLMQKEFEVELQIPESACYVQGNSDALQRVFFNLLSNALRYGSDGKYLGVFVRQDEKHVYIDIVDKGKGIDKSFAETVFERLFTMEDSRNRQIQGNGLGLTIARNLARQMNGDITLESVPYERTAFTLALRKMPGGIC